MQLNADHSIALGQHLTPPEILDNARVVLQVRAQLNDEMYGTGHAFCTPTWLLEVKDICMIKIA